MNRETMKTQLQILIEQYNRTTRLETKENVSEETIRTWLNEFLGLFGWDVQNTHEVLQERCLRGTAGERLREIRSPHRKPDYILVNGSNIKSFLDAKAPTVDIINDQQVAYQIRSYGWSAQVPCAFVSNFESFVIFDTRMSPTPDMPANYGATCITIDEYLEKFDVLCEHLSHDLICNNHLHALYETTAIEGGSRVDNHFSAVLSDFRLKIANNLLKNNESFRNDADALNYYTQVILDRIVFIRVCESKGIEEQEKLKSFCNSQNGFWESFKNSCYFEFYSHYDGPMFTRDAKFHELNVDNAVLEEFIQSLYYPYPYCFDVIPVKVIAKIYEEFLGINLVIKGNKVIAETKEEYIRTNGAVSTPEHIVDMICRQTIDITECQTVEELMEIEVLDPCCGSGVFLIACYEILAKRLTDILRNNANEMQSHQELFCFLGDELMLTMEARRAIVKNCLYGIDCDAAAIEVTKMSIALKIVDGNNRLAWEDIGAFGERVLREISDNIKLGNTLVDFDRTFNADQIVALKPLNIRNEFAPVFETHGGFRYIVGNPPYVETKHYKAASPIMHEYLTDKYVTFEGKADLSVLFIERCLSVLALNGKFGLIVQRRWFKTNYGRMARNMITNGHFLRKMIDFKATDIFPGRITYVSIMVLEKGGNSQLQYYYMPAEADTIRTRFENADARGFFEGCQFQTIDYDGGDSPWAFESFAIQSLKKRLQEKWGTLGQYPRLQVKDGIQALWKKMYHLQNVRFHNGIAIGKNGFNETVTVEEDILRAVIYNKVFYPFKKVEPNAYCIFPYNGASADPIRFNEIEIRYPLTYQYLKDNENRIKENVQCREGSMWHTFTREHNQSMYDVDKIIIPMTAKDTIATYISNRGLYMDNANVWFITIPNADDRVMKAITCVINSTIFSVLGKAGANPQAGEYYKFNKQFLTPIPLPSSKLMAGSDGVFRLSTLFDHITELQDRYLASSPNQKEIFKRALNEKWTDLDEVCFSMYEVTDAEKSQIQAIGRTISRIDLLNGAE